MFGALENPGLKNQYICLDKLWKSLIYISVNFPPQKNTQTTPRANENYYLPGVTSNGDLKQK
jgi:hypothetical protein